jgi:1-acyl-sn-glycerol-3-phosphate acyltransferase
MRKILIFLFSIYGFSVFAILMLVLFPLIAFSTLFGSIKGGNIIYRIITFWADAAMFSWLMPHHNEGEEKTSPDRAQVIVFNHTSFIDIPIMLKTLRRFQIRILAKASMSKVPIFGYIYKQGTIMVDRSSPVARAASIDRMKALIRKKISIVIAPEGTFNMTTAPLKEFYNGAFKIAIEMKVPIQPVIFLDAYDRLSYKSIFSLTPGRSVSVFLDPISTEGLTQDDMEQLKMKVFDAMEAALIKRNVSWIRNGQ